MITNRPWLILFALGILATFILSAAFYLIPESQTGLLLAVHILIGFAFGPTATLVWAIYTDAADFGEWKTGRRVTGLVMPACTMTQKFGYTFGGALGMAVLSYVGYQANAEQTPVALSGIKGMVSWVFALPCAVGFILVLLYPLNTKQLSTIESDLNARRASKI